MWNDNPLRLGFRNTYKGGRITGFQFKFRLSGTRGVYASMLSGGLSVKVDGVSYPLDNVSLKIRDITIPWSQIDNATEIFIAYAEPITVIVEAPGGLKDGLHKVELGYAASRGSAWNEDPELDPYFDFLPDSQRVKSEQPATPTVRLQTLTNELVLVI